MLAASKAEVCLAVGTPPLKDTSQVINVLREGGLLRIVRACALTFRVATYIYREEVALVTLDAVGAACIRTGASAFAELCVELEEETLFGSLGATLHPLALGHELCLASIGKGDFFWFLLDLDNLFAAILREENT